MKNKILGALIALGAMTQVLASSEQRFDPDLEKKCFKEVDKLKCGSPDGKHHKAFMKCVDSKMSKLSKGCQEMHKALSAEEHSGHNH